MPTYLRDRTVTNLNSDEKRSNKEQVKNTRAEKALLTRVSHNPYMHYLFIILIQV